MLFLRSESGCVFYGRGGFCGRILWRRAWMLGAILLSFLNESILCNIIDR